jgi:hypothetical protein
MHRFIGLLFAVCWLGAVSVQAGPARILKVLPHLLDQQGRHTLAPSLFERDAYQAKLRKSPDEVSALRFDVQWKRGSAKDARLRMRVEVRGGKAGAKPLLIEESAEFKGLFTAWSDLKISREEYLSLGGVSAWRASLWNGDTLLSEVKSFLW